MNLIGFQPQSVLVIRLSAIGDIIMASALIPTLREAYPNAKLAWMTDETHADLLRDNPRLDKVILWPRRRWRQLAKEKRYLTLWREFRALVKELRQERFELVLDIQGLLKSGVWAFLSGGRVRIGLGSKEGSQLLMSRITAINSGNDEDLRIGSEYLKLARELGARPNHFDMDIRLSEETHRQAINRLSRSGVSGSFAIICPFTTRPQKHWLEERWADVANRLAQELGLSVLMLGGPADRERAGHIVAKSPGLLNWVGQTSLIECAAIIESAALLVGVDTGLTHLGIAMKTPTLALFGSTRPYLDTGFELAKVLYEALPCSPCERHPICDGRFDCMKALTVDRILSAATSLYHDGKQADLRS